MPETTTRNDELGALWLSDRGDRLTGTIGGVKVICFKNDRATPENRQPAWRVLKAKARDEDTGPRQVVDVVADARDDEDSIPF